MFRNTIRYTAMIHIKYVYKIVNIQNTCRYNISFSSRATKTQTNILLATSIAQRVALRRYLLALDGGDDGLFHLCTDFLEFSGHNVLVLVGIVANKSRILCRKLLDEEIDERFGAVRNRFGSLLLADFQELSYLSQDDILEIERVVRMYQ